MKNDVDASAQRIQIHVEQVTPHELIADVREALVMNLASPGRAHEVPSIAQGRAQAESQAASRSGHQCAACVQKRNTMAAVLIPAAVPSNRTFAPG